MVKTVKMHNQKLALRADSGLSIGTIYTLSSKRNILGRSVDVEVPVDDSKVSRVHASIDEQNGVHYLVDLGSTNGTYLNGDRVQLSSRVSPGDRVRVGSAVFVVELLDVAKSLVGRTWKEPTRAILFGEEQRARACANLEENLLADRRHDSLGKLGQSKLRKASSTFVIHFRAKQKRFLERNGRLFSVVSATLLVAAAIASTFHRV